MSRGHGVVRVLACAAVVAAASVVPVPWGAGVVHAVPNVTISQTIPSQTLIGATTSVTAHIGNSGDTTAFNLMLVLRLPPGIHLATSEIPPANTIVETVGGVTTGTVVSFENIVDIVPGGAYNFSYTLSHDVGTEPDEWEVFDPVPISMEAHVSGVEATVPDTEPQTTGSDTTAVITDSTQSNASGGSTQLVPILLTKSEPSPEGELLRGVHDHQTVYTLTAQTGAAAGVAVGLVDDYLPAGLEFLGCGTADNSSAEEYPGSGPINPGNAPALPAGTCRTPTLVETVANPPGLPGGVYTHVQWDISQTLPLNSVVSMTYVAAIPMYENTMAWPDGAPSPASLAQGSNLDNNTGPLTTQVGEGDSYTNFATVGTTFDGATGPVEAQTTVQAVDLAIHKYVDRQEINQGEISTWTLQLQTSEYVVDGGVAGLAITDVTPNGACPIGSDHTGCTATTEPGPDPVYSDTTFPATGPNGGPGTTELEWDLASATMGPNEEMYVNFSTVALTAYANGTPISTNDEWTNHVDMDANVTTFEDEGPDGTHELGRDVVDTSAASQSGSDVSFEKEVSRPADGQTCGNGVGLDWQPEAVAGTGPGDRVCFRLTATPPDFLDTIEATLSDFLPVGFDYEGGSATAGPENDVPASIVNTPDVFGDPDTGERIDWTLVPSAFIEPAQVAQVVFGAIMVGGTDSSMPDVADSGDVLTNEARYSYENTSGEIFVAADDADLEYTEALLDLTKGIIAVDAAEFDPAIDTATDVNGGQAVTYEIVVTNSGTSDATGVEVLDTLPINNDGITDDDAICGEITDISDGGGCAGGDITWSGLTVPAEDFITLEYTWTLPADVSAATSWTNEAGVVEYHSATNTGTEFEYVPRDNIDSSREPDANTEPADDDAHVFSPGISVTKTRTTSVAEAGNALSDQATIGETITYTIEYRQSEGTTVTDPTLTDTLPATLDLIEPIVVETFQTPPGAPCASGTPAAPLTADVAGNTFTIEMTGDVTAPVGLDACSVITFDAVVLDAGGPFRPGSVTNTATVEFLTGTEPRTATASVSTAIVEPNLTLDKRVGASSSVLPGAQVPYDLVVTNVSATQVSSAHDLVVVDELPSEVLLVTGISPAGVVDDPLNPTSITWTLDPGFDLDPGESLTLSYTATLESPLDASTTMTNRAKVTATSLAGSVAGERTGASACTVDPHAVDANEVCPGYDAVDAVTVTVGGPALTKTVAQTDHTFGHTVDYTLTAVFPANLDFGPTTLTDDLAGGDLEFLRTVNAICIGCTDADRSQYVPPPDGLSTTPPVWDFGDVGPSPVTRRAIVTFRAVVVDTGAGNGAIVTNTATLDWELGELDDTAEITLFEPELTLAKRVASTYEPGLTATDPANPVQAQAGDTLSYDLTITNEGDWTAYDVLVEDVPDTVGSTDCTGTSRLTDPTVATDPAWTVTDASLADDACLRWEIPSLLPGQTVVLTYTVVVPADFDEFITGNEFVNLASVPEYWALTESERTISPDDVREYPTATLVDNGYVDLNHGLLGDFVWFDIDGDGAQDAGEPGIPDVTVDVAGPQGTTPYVTDAGGEWLTYDGVTLPPTWLEPATYTVTVDETTLPVAGLFNSGDPDGGNDSTSTVALAENGEDLDQDFGYTGTGGLGDTVWLDVDGDGVQVLGEPGIAGVTVGLVWAGWNGLFGDGDDVVYPDVVTDASGVYGFENLAPGNYQVTVDTSTLPVELVGTFELDGTLDANTSVSLGAGEVNLDVDFGFAGEGAVGDTVWLDRIDDDIRQPLIEPGIAGVVITATWGGYDGVIGGGDDIAWTTTITDTDGEYLIEHLPPGEVEIVVDDAALLAAGLVRTFDPDTTLDATTVRTLAVGEIDLFADFAYNGANEIGDLVWYDIDADGLGPDSLTPDPEPGIPDQTVIVRWAGPNGTFDDGDDLLFLPTTTDSDGRWSVDGLPNGNVRVTLVNPPATNLDATYDRDTTLDLTTELNITGNDTDFDYGLTGTGLIGDRVWLDYDADGAQDAGEPGLVGVDVTVRWAGWNGTFDLLPGPGNDDVVHPIQTTTATGAYEVGNLPPGRYRVTIDDATLPAGVEPTFDLDGVATADVAIRTLGTAEVGRDVDFGYAGTAALGDFVWWDLDGDLVQGPAEPGIPGAAVTAVWSGVDGALGTIDDKVLPVATTDASGRYEFVNLPAGAFRVNVVAATLPVGLHATFDLDGGADGSAIRAIAVADSADDVDFGYVGDLTVGDLVWDDVNQDDVRQLGEPAIAGAGITLQYLGRDGEPGGGDDVFFAAITANPSQAVPSGRVTEAAAPVPGDPFYEVAGLVPGAYIATLDEATLPSGVVPVSDLDGDDPVVTHGTLAADSLDVDFVVFQNIAPLPPAPGTAAQVACGSAVVVDPTAGVTDANGDALSLVPGSVLAPVGVTVDVLTNGNLRITTAPTVRDGSQVQWTVQDAHGATTPVVLTLDVNCITATATIACSTGGVQLLSYQVTGVGGPATAPVTITWYGTGGAQLFVSTGQPVSGQLAWPSTVPRDGVTVGFRGADGATTVALDPGVPCGQLPATGGDLGVLLSAGSVLVTLGFLLHASRRFRLR